MPDFVHGIQFKDLPTGNGKLTPLQSFLIHRMLGAESYDNYLQATLADLPSPFLLPDLEETIDTLKLYIQQKKHILLYGDRDTDGVSSTSQMAIFLREQHEKNGGKLTIKTSSANDDYGLCDKALSFIRKNKPDLLITLDFGSTNYDEINSLANSGMKIIVVDHHVVPEKIPNCLLVNPKRQDSQYPEEKICTSVLVMKLILAYAIDSLLSQQVPTNSDGDLGLKINYQNLSIADIFDKYPAILKLQKQLLDLASIGTITDMMPLRGENRIIVKNGLLTLRELSKNIREDRKGLYYLMAGLNLNGARICSRDLGWSIGPALNAAGRMGQTEVSLKLLLANDNREAEQTAQQLIRLNEERKERTRRNVDRVERYFARKIQRETNRIIFCYEPDMEPGVSGIVATKLTQKYKKPAIFVTPDHGHARGSVRSFGKENVITLLDLLSDLFIHFGGHPEAGGFSIPIDKIPLLEKRLPEAADSWLDESVQKNEPVQSSICFRGEQLKESIYKQICLFEPFGQGNPQPLISVEKARILSYRPMSGGLHGKFSILGADAKIKGVVWNRGHEFEALLSQKAEIDLWGHLEENYFNGKTTIQMSIQGFC